MALSSPAASPMRASRILKSSRSGSLPCCSVWEPSPFGGRADSLVSGRSALVFWLLVLLLHVGFGTGIALTGEEIGSSRELLLLLPFAAFTLSAATAATRGAYRPRRTPLGVPHALFAGRLRFPASTPDPRRFFRGRRAGSFFSPTAASLLSTPVVLPASRPPGVPAA